MPEPAASWNESWVWLGGSLFLAALSANVAWLFRHPKAGPIGEFVTRLIAWNFSPWLLQILRLAYYVGVPFAALIWGNDAVTEILLGFRRAAGATGADNWLDWVYDAGWAATLGIGAWGFLALGWWAYRRALMTVDVSSAVPGSNTSGWTLLRRAIYHEVHWGFYRNAPILALDKYLGFTLAKYWGTWVGLALVALETVLNPAWRRELADAKQAPTQLMRVALAIVSSILFLQTGNLWLALVLHFLVSFGLSKLMQVLPTSGIRNSSGRP